MIDVNSGSFTGRGKGGLEETITRVNTEAAEEAVRQLRLRDIGGIIVIDFIDMARARNRDKVLKTLRKALDADKSKSYVVEVSPLGLVEMTRQNVTDGVREILTVPCPTCEGEGVVLSAETVALDGMRRLPDVAAGAKDAEALLLRVNPKVAAELIDPDSGLAELEAETGKQFHFEGGDALPIDTFDMVESGTRAEIEERALPFKVGEEVLVKIDEPHMYNADDAVARVDSYIVSVTGGGRFVGERKLVRIERVERAAAVASLPGVEATNGVAGGGENGSELESSPSRSRRRGRRGGRGRSRSTQEQGRMNTYAVIESGGKQYKVEKGTSLLVDRLERQRGRQGGPAPGDVPRQRGRRRGQGAGEGQGRGDRAEHLRGEKIKVFKYKAKKGYRRRAGHRSELTKLEVTEVKLLTRKPAAAKEEPAEAKPAAAEKPVEAKKPAATKPAEAKKPAEKKPAAKKEPAKKAAPKKPAAKAKKPAAKKPAAKPAAKKDSDDGS